MRSQGLLIVRGNFNLPNYCVREIIGIFVFVDVVQSAFAI